MEDTDTVPRAGVEGLSDAYSLLNVTPSNSTTGLSPRPRSPYDEDARTGFQLSPVAHLPHFGQMSGSFGASWVPWQAIWERGRRPGRPVLAENSLW